MNPSCSGDLHETIPNKHHTNVGKDGTTHTEANTQSSSYTRVNSTPLPALKEPTTKLTNSTNDFKDDARGNHRTLRHCGLGIPSYCGQPTDDDLTAMRDILYPLLLDITYNDPDNNLISIIEPLAAYIATWG